MVLVFLTFVFLFGLIIGSFLNCLIWRLYKGEGMTGRSYCPHCRHQIAWFDNIPVLSFSVLGGRCRNCKQPISIQYPLVELATGLLFALSFVFNLQLSDDFSLLTPNFLLLALLRDWFLISVMIIVFIYDLRWYMILDIVVLPASAIILGLNLLLGYDWQGLLISGIIGSSFFLVQFAISKGKWIGGGDIRLGLLMGLALGWPNVLAAILLAYFIGSITAIGLVASGRKSWSSKLPLGVFLSVSSLIVLFYGKSLVDWYMALVGF